MTAPEIRRKIVNRLLLKDEPTPPTDPPSERSIRRIKREFEALTPAEKQPYTLFSWPESMESGALPWQASRAGLDLLRGRYEAGLQGRPAPRVREVRCLWQVIQAIPDAPVKKQIDISGLVLFCAELERTAAFGPHATAQASAWFQFLLAYQPWRSVEDKAAWSRLPDEVRTPPAFLSLLRGSTIGQRFLDEVFK